MESIFFVGGTRSGKSGLAQRWAEAQAPRRLYLATCRVEDAEMAARVALHQKVRGAGWECREEPLDPMAVLTELWAGQQGAGPQTVGVVLLDCISLWLANLLAAGLSHEVALGRVQDLVEAISGHQCDQKRGQTDDGSLNNRIALAVVSSEVGSGIVPVSALGRQYRDVLGQANQMLARACKRTVLVSCGLPLALKGGLPECLS